MTSQKRKGACFTLCLPATELNISPKQLPLETVLTGNETILLIEDERMIPDVGVEILKKLGYPVLTEQGGKEALQIHSENREHIDLVILDVITPDMGGATVFNALKSINPEAKVLLSSGYSMDDKTTANPAHLYDGFLTKPFTLGDLSYSLREILDKC